VSGKVWAYGYRVGEVRLADIPPVKDSAKYIKSVKKHPDLESRPVVLSDLGCVIDGVCLPHCDPLDPDTTLAGVAKRFAFKPPTPESELLLKFKRFVRNWIEENLDPLAPDSDTSVRTWLESTTYPRHRKEELMEKWTACEGRLNPKEHYKCKSFMKDECYPEFKHARAINSRSDEFKCRVGPIFRLIEKQVFKCHHFIKRIPVADRPKYILELLNKNGAKYMATDYTAYEAQFVAEIMDACEFQLFDYMTEGLPEGQDFMELVRTVLGGENVCEFKWFTIVLEATRMSGEMCTSLGNGFSNLMFMLFMCQEVGCTKVEGVVEGDDGLFSMIGTPPTQEDFARLGLVIKIDLHDNIEEASFCGLIFDIVDRLNITDPREVLASIGWSSATYARSGMNKRKTLLRCKALSAAYQYPGCPVLVSMSKYLLRVTRSYDVRDTIRKWQNTYEREQLIAALSCDLVFLEPPMNTRLLVEKKFGITVEHQLHLERYFDNLETLTRWRDPILIMLMPDCWKQYWAEYVLPSALGDPGMRWTQCEEYKLTNPLSATV